MLGSLAVGQSAGCGFLPRATEGERLRGSRFARGRGVRPAHTPPAPPPHHTRARRAMSRARKAVAGPGGGKAPRALQLPTAEERAENRKNPNHVYVSMEGPRNRLAADFRPRSRQVPGPRVTVGWLKKRQHHQQLHDAGQDHRFLLPANVSIRDIVRMFTHFPETIDGFLDQEDLPDFLEYAGIAVRSQAEVAEAVRRVLGEASDGLVDHHEIQKFFLANPVFVPVRRDQGSRRSSRQGVRTSRNASREARRRAHSTRRIVVKPATTGGRVGGKKKPFCNFGKYRKMAAETKRKGGVVRMSGRAKGSWDSFPKYANLSAGVPYLGPHDKAMRDHQESKKRFVGGDFHVAVTSKAKQRDWAVITAGSGLDHGKYVSQHEKYAQAERARKAKFIVSGGFIVC